MVVHMCSSGSWEVEAGGPHLTATQAVETAPQKNQSKGVSFLWANEMAQYGAQQCKPSGWESRARGTPAVTGHPAQWNGSSPRWGVAEEDRGR